MRNEKQNDFWVNLDLFKTSYLKARIYRRSDFPSATSKRIISIWDALQKLWADDSLQRILTSPNVRESVTEDKWIDPVLSILNFSTLSKTRLGKNSFPDYGLFPSEEKVADALNAEAELRFSRALSILEGKYFGRDLLNSKVTARDDRSTKGLPPMQLVGYLRQSDLRWGILTNGEQWQLYYSKGAYSETRYFEMNLPDLLEHKEITPEFCLFVYLFAPDAFAQRSGESRLDNILSESQKFAQEMGPSFFKGCETALKRIFFEYQRQEKALNSIEKSEKCYTASLILLFRLIAIRFLEDRGILPTLSSPYRRVSLDVIRSEIENTFRNGKNFKKSDTEVWQRLRLLFNDVNTGTFGIYPGHRGFESDLFNLNFDDFFRNHPVSDDILAESIDSICRGTGRDKGQFDFYDLGVEKIGDVYNDLLGLRLVSSEDGIILTESTTRKKELGSYFTHSSLTELVTESTTKYLNSRYPNRTDWLQVRVCDNSCGSGHFLRAFIEEISYQLFTSESNQGDDSDKAVSQNSFRRMLAQHSVYGIDRDIYAVWLTRLSLWLQTAETGKPFVYLDRHIVKGDSILSSISNVTLAPSDQKNLNGLFRDLNGMHSDTVEKVRETKKIWDRVSALIKGKNDSTENQTRLKSVPERFRNNFFEYDVRFPDVFLNGNSEAKGFTIIVGNPPWDTVKPKAPEFYKMKTGHQRPPSRKKVDRWIEADDKRVKEYEEWANSIKAYADGIRESGYSLQKGEVYTYAYFIERSMQSLQNGGLLSYVVKLGLYGDQKVANLRSHLFRNNSLNTMWIFKKNKVGNIKLFPKVDPNEKFVVFNCEKRLRGKYEVNAKNISKLEDINASFEPWQKYSVPKELNDENIVYVFDSGEAAKICRKLDKFSTIKDLGFSISRELDVTMDRRFFSKQKEKHPIYSGDELQHFLLKKPGNWCKDESLLVQYPNAAEERIGVNNILPNSRRKFRAAVIPGNSLTANSILLITGFQPEQRNTILGALNGLITEFKLRPTLSNMNLNNFRLESLPLPIGANEKILNQINEEVEKLIKKGEFRESSNSYKKIEALLCTAYELNNGEINAYLSSFKGIDESFINDVIDYTEEFRKTYRARKSA